ncbi:hypothetical protein EC9_01310 [Rosistilla ulvae]|uniref:DUF2442 domain-containing protein n=1 Tax=Rosistilla ulvae TaxID=1930277 RepID=A0A517LTL9_9BACT|nr:DUF2442 domain-containing protein [Rosistilla ulvae]QDS85973.1 hypothetical protein EC9_01310 [Rosistilla ulvae]
MAELLHVVAMNVPCPFHLELKFSDGDARVVDLRPLLNGPAFLPLHDPDVFASATIDPVSKTVCWPCGVDLAPEALTSLSPADIQSAG